MAEAAQVTQTEPAPLSEDGGEDAQIAPVSARSLIGSASSEAASAGSPPADANAAPSGATAKAEPQDPGLFDPGSWKAPEGVKVDQEMLKSFSETLNDAKLKGADRGAKLLDMHQAALTKAVQQVTEGNTKAWTDTLTQWETEIKSDPRIGGDRLDPTLQSISKLLDMLGPEGSKGFKQGMTITGAGSYPAVVRGMAQIAVLMTEGQHVPGSPGGGKGKSITEMFFPNSPDMKGDT